MAVIDIRDENLSKEKEELETLRSTIEQRITSIDNQLATLKEFKGSIICRYRPELSDIKEQLASINETKSL